MRPRLIAFALLGVLLLAACGMEDGGTASRDQVPVQDTTVPPIQRQPLTEIDQVGLDPFDLSVEVPWTGNRLTRAPAEAAPRATILEAETLTTEAFDRVLFRFSRDAPFPGYQVRQLEDPAALDCPGDGEASVEAGPLLVVTLRPVYGDRESASSTPFETVGQPLFQEAGVVCRGEDSVVWAARIAGGSEARVLELRNPLRLAVDLR